MMKKMSIALIAFILLIHSSWGWGASIFKEIQVYFPSIEILHQQEKLVLTDEAFIYNQRVYVPLRTISEGLGYRVDWHQQEKRVVIKDQTPDEILPPTDPFKGEAFIYGEIMKVDYENKLIEIEQHLENNSREVFEALSPTKDAVFILKRNLHHWPIAFEDVKVGDVVGIILTKDNEIRGMIVD